MIAVVKPVGVGRRDRIEELAVLPNAHVVFVDVIRIADRAVERPGGRVGCVAGVPNGDELHARLAVGHIENVGLPHAGRPRQHARQHGENHCMTMRHDGAPFSRTQQST